jgi:hypothetical protein
MHALPFSDGAFDEILMLNVRSYSEEPEITSRERRKPYFEVLTAFARRPATESATSSRGEEAS